MKYEIKDMKIYSALSKMSKPIADATHTISDIAFYVVELTTAEGITGQGYLLSFHYSPKAIEGALKDMKKFILEKGYCVNETLKMKHDYEQECEYFGNLGLLRWAQAAVNVAMWDAWGKILGQPIYKILGSNGKKIRIGPQIVPQPAHGASRHGRAQTQTGQCLKRGKARQRAADKRIF